MQASAGRTAERSVRLPREELLHGANAPEAMEELVKLAEDVLRTWQPAWSGFVSGPVREEALIRLNSLSELTWQSVGGYPGSERQRLLCHRSDDRPDLQIPIHGLLIEGNFLFDPLSSSDLRQALLEMGAREDDLGDLWVRGDRGGQGLCTPACSEALDGRSGRVRDVEIRCEALPVDQLQLPAQRSVRVMQTVEASCRLDAIASAGFGVSRAKVVDLVKQGRLRVNWQSVNQPSRDLVTGDRLHLEDRGTVEVLTISKTKRDRWRVELKRS